MDCKGPGVNPIPNPMNARCGLENCDCEYTIGGLLKALEERPSPAWLSPISAFEECYDNWFVTAQATINKAKKGK